MPEQTVEHLWTDACNHLQEVLHSDVFSRWIAIITPVSMDDKVLVLGVDNDFYQTWLEDNYLSLIQDALLAAGGAAERRIEFRIVARSAPTADYSLPTKPITATRGKAKSRSSRPSHPKPSLNPKFTFDEFVVGPSNSFGHAAALAVANAPGRAYNPLFIYGETGLGKTHLMQAIGQHVLEHNPDLCIRYLSSETMLNEYVNSLQKGGLADFRLQYRSSDVLLVDDIHFLANKKQLQEEFFHTFNVLYDARKQIIMTSDRPASEIAGLEQRLVSRFEWGLVTELECPDFETRLAILQYKQSHAQVKIADDLLYFIAQNVKSNVRRLEGALVRAISYSSLTGKHLTLEALKYLLRDTLEQEREEDLTCDVIQRAVAEHFDVRVTDMSSKRRPRHIAAPRQVAMYLCRRMTQSSLPEIATAFGKTHATVLHACKAVNGRMDVDDDLRQNLHTITRKLGRDPVALQI